MSSHHIGNHGTHFLVVGNGYCTYSWQHEFHIVVVKCEWSLTTESCRYFLSRFSLCKHHDSIPQFPFIITRELQSSRIATDFQVDKRQLISVELYFQKRNNKTQKETTRITLLFLCNVLFTTRIFAVLLYFLLSFPFVKKHNFNEI